MFHSCFLFMVTRSIFNHPISFAAAPTRTSARRVKSRRLRLCNTFSHGHLFKKAKKSYGADTAGWRLSSQAESSRLFCHWNSAHHFLAFFFTASNSCFRVGQHAHFLPLKFLEPFIAKKMSWGHGFAKLL